MQPLKELYFPADSYHRLAKDLYMIYPKFSIEAFVQDALIGLDELELKQRMVRVVELFDKYLPDYPETLEILAEYIKGRENNFYYLHLPLYVSTHGLDYYDLSIKALKEFTSYSSSEDAIRYFLLQDFEQTMKHVMDWAEDGNYHVRRLASEGTRPRLPWCVQLKEVISNPKLTLPVLEKLKEDPEKYVQKSVANHLNDYSKDHADFVVDVVSNWNCDNKVTKWIIGHGTRSLVKQGHKRCLDFLGYGEEPKVSANISFLGANKEGEILVKMGEVLEFVFEIKSVSDKTQKLVIDYKMYFMKANGKQSPKVFKLSTTILQPHECKKIVKRYKFKDLSTRKHYSGEHALELVINGDDILKVNYRVV